MRLLSLIKNEFRFMLKYGIIFIYCAFTIFYLCVLSIIPESARQITAVILVFTDPAAMGLFFMGAVVLLEKSERVSNAIAVSPVRRSEYIFAKVFSMLVTGCIVGLILCIFSGLKNYLYILFGIALASSFFSTISLIIASKVESLNSFMIATIPVELAICLPPILYMFQAITSPLWIIHPGVAAIKMINCEKDFLLLDIISLILWATLSFIICRKEVDKSFAKLGGGRL